MGYYLIVTIDRVTHLYFERDRDAIEKAWRYVYSRTGKEGNVYDNTGTLLHSGGKVTVK